MQAVPLTSRRVHVFPVQCHVVLVSTDAVAYLIAKQAHKQSTDFGSFVSILHKSKSELLRGNEDALSQPGHTG